MMPVIQINVYLCDKCNERVEATTEIESTYSDPAITPLPKWGDCVGEYEVLCPNCLAIVTMGATNES